MTESNVKSKSDRCESTKSTVINAKNRKSEDRDRIHRQDRRRSRDSSSRLELFGINLRFTTTKNNT